MVTIIEIILLPRRHRPRLASTKIVITTAAPPPLPVTPGNDLPFLRIPRIPRECNGLARDRGPALEIDLDPGLLPKRGLEDPLEDPNLPLLDPAPTTTPSSGRDPRNCTKVEDPLHHHHPQSPSTTLCTKVEIHPVKG